MNINKSLAAALIAGFALTACGGGAGGGQPGTNPPNPGHQATIGNDILQFAVGSANIAGTAGLNVVATYRQPTGAYAPGDSATLINSPTLTVPGALPGTVGGPATWDGTSTINGTPPNPGAGTPEAPGGPSNSEVGGHVMTSTSQNFGSNLTTFGLSGGVFGVGIEPFNEAGTSGQPFTYAPYPVPLYDPTSYLDVNQFTPWGGQPAFNPSGSGGVSIVGNGDYPGGSAGVSMGLDVFQGVTSAPGQYSLGVSVPANTGTVNASANFSLGSNPGLLPLSSAVFTPDASGNGGTAALTLGAGTTEAYVEIIDYGPAQVALPPGSTVTNPVSCNGASEGSPLYYTLSSEGTLTLGDALAPGGGPSICTEAQNAALAGNATVGAPAAVTGDQYVISVIGFDYPQYEMTYPNSLKNPSPTIVGGGLIPGNPSDDIAISAASCNYQPAGGGAAVTCNANLPLIRERAAAARAKLTAHARR